MNFIHRALRNVLRKISKSIILMLTFFVIGNFVVIGLGVSDASAKAKILTRQKMRAVINYEVNFMKWFQSVKDDDYSNFPYITEEEIEVIKQDSRVKSINAITTDLAYASSFESISIDNKKEKEMNASSESENCSIDEEGNRMCEKSSKGYKEADLKIQANAYPDMIEFIDNIYILKEGNMFTEDDIAQGRRVALITDALAQHNQIRVGDTIIIMFDNKENLSNTGSYMHKANITEEDVTLELEVIGIFDNTSEIGPNLPNFDWMSRYESPENIIVVPDKPINELRFNMSIKLWDWMVENEPNEFTRNPNNRPTKDSIAKKSSITILLHDPMSVDEFVEEYKNNLPEDSFIQLDANNETFQKLAKPLDTLSLYASFIVWLVVVNAVIIISLVTALTLKTREFEIGVLLSMGVSKLKIVLQFFLELAIVAVVGFTLAVISGSLMAKKAGETILSYQVSKSDVSIEEKSTFFDFSADYFTDVTIEDLTSNYEVSISPLIIAQIYVAGLGIVLISILIPSLMIMRFNPKRILMSAQ